MFVCWTAETNDSSLSADVAQSCAAAQSRCDSVGLDSISSQVGGGGSDSGRGSPYTFYKNRHETHN